jgi:enamine deaminase RidA (YjgF/YER057c/UK114 family)
VETLLPIRLGDGNVHFAQGIRAGRWVFVSGLLAQDFKHGIAPQILSEPLPHAEAPKREKEAAMIFDHLEAVLAAGQSDIANLVRTDQYYTTAKAVPPYQSVRMSRLRAAIPPSTSVVQDALLLPDADIHLQAIAVVPDGSFRPQHLSADSVRSRPTSGYSAALAAGDYVFIAGITAMAQPAEPQRNAIAQQARLESGMQWGGLPIELETEFIISERIIPSLELAGATTADVVKAQVYLTDANDCAAFHKVWLKHFEGNPPALSIIPCAHRGLVVEEGRIEINAIALRSDGAAKKEIVDAGVFPGFEKQPQAVRAGDLLLLSGLMAADRGGVVPHAMPDAHQPFYQSTAKAQAEYILDNVEKICAAAGTSIENVVRIQQFHTDLREFYPVYECIAGRLGDRPVPFSAVQVPGTLPIPGCTILFDIWIYAP